VVEVEEGGLGPLEQHVLAGLEGLVDQVHRVGHVGLQLGGDLLEVDAGDLVGRGRHLVVDLGQHLALLLERHVELLPEDLGVVEVLHPQPHPGRLVGVGGADAPAGGAQLVLAQVPLGHPVDLLVVGQHQVGVRRHPQPRAVDAPAGEAGDLVEQDDGVDHHPVADDRDDVVVEHAAGHELQGVALVVDHQGVARVVAALVADDHVHLLGEEIGELALPLVTPLGSDHDRRRHVCSCSRPGNAAA
jgi:hypothetical protein